MPGPDEKAEKKKIETTKKAIAGEVKKLGKKTKPKAEEAKKLAEEKKEAQKVKKPTPEQKKKLKEIDLKLKGLQKICQSEADKTSKQIANILKMQVPDDKKALPVWQKGMDRWYIDILNKEPGLAIGGGVRVNGDLSIKDKKGVITFSGKW